VAHQWWAHQVIGANVQGATLLSETLAEVQSEQTVDLTEAHPSRRHPKIFVWTGGDLFVASTSPLTVTRTVVSDRWHAVKIARWCCSRRSSEPGSGRSTRQVPIAGKLASLSRKHDLYWGAVRDRALCLKAVVLGSATRANDVTSWLLTQPDVHATPKSLG